VRETFGWVAKLRTLAPKMKINLLSEFIRRHLWSLDAHVEVYVLIMIRITRNLQALKVPRAIQYRSASDSSRPFPPSHPTRPTLSENSSQSTTSVSQDTVANQDDSTVFAPALEELANTSKPFNLASDKLEPPRFDDYFNRHHFDTFKLLRALEQQGFTRTQAEVIMKGIKFKLRHR
jgi:hypothetical protein